MKTQTQNNLNLVRGGANIPVSGAPSQELRALRKEAHDYFNRLHYSGRMSRAEAFAWLAAILETPHSQAHIGPLTEYYCRIVIEESKKIFAKPRPGAQGRSAYVPKRRTAETG
jgi:hypothetical protein